MTHNVLPCLFLLFLLVLPSSSLFVLPSAKSRDGSLFPLPSLSGEGRGKRVHPLPCFSPRSSLLFPRATQGKNVVEREEGRQAHKTDLDETSAEARRG